MNDVRTSRNFVGVVPPSAFDSEWYAKRLLLMFDKLALDLKQGKANSFHKLLTTSPDFRWLNDEGLVTTVSGLVAGNADPRDVRRQPQVDIKGGDLISAALGIDAEDGIRWAARSQLQLALRYSAAELRSLHGIDAVAIPSAATPLDVDAIANRDTVVRITLAEFPAPGPESPWRSLVEFRRDPESRAQFARLKSWINRVARLQMQHFEAKDELLALIDEHEAYLKAHRIRPERGSMNVMVTAAPQIADEINNSWSSKSEPSFTVEGANTNLMKSERTVGQEVEYIISARDAFR